MGPVVRLSTLARAHGRVDFSSWSGSKREEEESARVPQALKGSPRDLRPPTRPSLLKAPWPPNRPWGPGLCHIGLSGTLQTQTTAETQARTRARRWAGGTWRRPWAPPGDPRDWREGRWAGLLGPWCLALMGSSSEFGSGFSEGERDPQVVPMEKGRGCAGEAGAGRARSVVRGDCEPRTTAVIWGCGHPAAWPSRGAPRVPGSPTCSGFHTCVSPSASPRA